MRSRKLRPEELATWRVLVVNAVALVTVAGSRGVHGSSDRHILAASTTGPGGECGLQFEGMAKSFTQCQSLTSDLGEDYTVLWNYIPLATSGTSGQPQGRLEMAIDTAANSNSWIALGIPRYPGQMIGASAIIVRTNATAPSGAAGAQYLLGGYSVSRVVPGGVLTVQNLTSAFSKGRLQAVFTLAQATPIKSSIPIIVAVGPLKADGSLREHSSKSAAQLPIISTPSSPATPSTAAAASPTPESEARAVPRIVLTAAPQPQATSAAPQTPAASPMPADGPAEAAACGLQFQGATMPFSQCQSLANDLGADYNVLWNYTPLPSGAGTSQGRLDVAIDAAAKPNSYVGFGIPQQPDAMVGASAVVVKTDAASPSGASATQYLLGGYSVDQVKPGGNLVIQNLTYAFSKGRLQAVFTLAQVTSSDSNVPIIVAVGSLTADGSLQQHDSSVGAKLATLGAAAAPAASPSGTAFIRPQSTGAQPQPPVRVRAASVESPESPESAVAPAAGVGCALTAPGEAPRTFTACTVLTGAKPDFKLLWRVNTGDVSVGGRRLHAAPPAAGGTANVTFAVDAAKPSGWVGVGIPSSPGQMVGANAMFFRVCPTCPTGGKADWRYLAGKSTSGVQGTGRLPVDNVQVWVANGRILGSFNLQVDPASLAGQPIIYASGPVSSSGAYLYHSDGQGGITADLESGSVSEGGDSNSQNLAWAHGWIMALSWGCLIPLGAVIARNFKTLGATWFNVHRVIQTVGWLLGWVGLGIGVYLTTTYNLHQRLGIAIQVLGTLQVLLAAFLRPTHHSRWRRTWNLGHWWIGRVAIGLGIANVYIGLIDEAQEGTEYVVAYSVVLGAIVITEFSKEFYDYLMLPPPAVDYVRPPHYLSTDPVIAAKPYAGLGFQIGALHRGGGESTSNLVHELGRFNSGTLQPGTAHGTDRNGTAV